MTSSSSSSSFPLKFSSFASQVDPSFWFTLSTLKLNSWKLDASPRPTYGIYSTPLRQTPSGDGTIEFNSGAFDESMVPDGYASARGWTCNFNTEEDWRSQRLSAAKQLEDNFMELIKTKSEEILANPALLTPFHLLSYANLKKYTFDHHFSFPLLPSKWIITKTRSVDKPLIAAIEHYIAHARPSQRGFFVILNTKVSPLATLMTCDPKTPVVIGYLNSSITIEGAPLQNLLTFLSLHPHLPQPTEILSYRRSSPSHILEIAPTDSTPGKLLPRWETDFSGRRVARRHNLSTLMDPKQRISEARDLNNNLMRWRVAEGIDLEGIKRGKVAVLGMGTLGCGVVRTLMGWGANQFKIVDNGVVSFSNPARQSLYTFDDCLSGSTLKVDAAAAAMAKIDPGVEVDSYSLTIPMPDHPNSFIEKDYQTFLEIMDWADVIFLLVDTREARWFPTLIATAMDKLVINAAVGFESFVVMRHGLPSQHPSTRLGCYFCSDIVSPQNSTDKATLDEQCTVTRPGIATLTASMASELYISITQHPQKAHAPPPSANTVEPTFGSCPHQIRGHLSNWEQQCLSGQASQFCAGCGDRVVKEWRERGEEFVKKVCERGGGKEVERVCGLEEIKKEFDEGWDGEDGEGEDDEWEL